MKRVSRNRSLSRKNEKLLGEIIWNLNLLNNEDRRLLKQNPGCWITRQYVKGEFAYWKWQFGGAGPDPEKLREWTGLTYDMTAVVDVPGVGIVRIPAAIIDGEVKTPLPEELVPLLGVYLGALGNVTIPPTAPPHDLLGRPV